MTEASIDSSVQSMPREIPETAEIAHYAGIVAAGSAAGRILGLGREAVKSHYFGAGDAADALTIAVRVPILLYDLFIGGMITSTLVPLFVKYAEDGRRRLWEFLSVVATLGTIAFALVTLFLVVFAAPISAFMSSGSSTAVLAQTTILLRLTAPATLFLSLSGILMGALYALKRFAFPAFAAAILNGGIVLGTLLLQEQLGPGSMALGLLLGAVLQLALQRRGLNDVPLHFRFDLRHPGIRRLSTLYLPIFLGLLFEVMLSRPLTYRLASLSGAGGISRMEYAQILSQFPRGLVALGISAAVLPLLARHAAQEREGTHQSRAAFRSTLARGMRLILVLIIPAALGMFILAQPVVVLLLEHGSFLPQDTLVTAHALQLYLTALPVAAVDGLLVYAFFARQDTATPAIAGVGSVALYLLLAFALQPILGLYGIVVADGLKLAGHLALLLVLLGKKLGGFGRHGLLPTLLRTLLAAGIMGIWIWGLMSILPAPATYGSITGEITQVILPALAGLIVYILLAAALGVEEMLLLWTAVKKQAVRILGHG
jgi:putative peptidoglycan lipid II flippase